MITLERMKLDIIEGAELEGVYEFPICKPTEKLPIELKSIKN